jgi:hypothetical protein
VEEEKWCKRSVVRACGKGWPGRRKGVIVECMICDLVSIVSDFD